MKPTPSQLNPPSQLPLNIDDLVVSALIEHDAPGCSVAVSFRGTSWVGAYGLARTDPALPFLPDTRIPVASMTKPFTATAVLALVEAGQVHLDDPVRKYLPDFRVADADASEQVTVRHLLTHRPGWLGDEPEFVTDRGSSALADQVAAFATLPQVLPPGATFSYCNTGLDVAGRLVEVLRGESYEAVIENTILKPLGMTHSTFFAEQVVSASAAAGHTRTARGSLETVQDAWLLPRGVNPSGGLLSSAPDQLRWMKWWLGELDDETAGPLSPSTRMRMINELEPVIAGRAATGLGWHIDRLADVNSVYHEGSLPGTATVCRFVPERDLAIVVLTNVEDGQLVYHAISRMLLEGLTDLRENTLTAAPDVAESALAEYQGSYRTPERREGYNGVEIVGDHGTLRLTVTIVHFDEPIEMRARQVEGDLFVLTEKPWTDGPVEFLRGRDNDLVGVRIAGRVLPRIGGVA